MKTPVISEKLYSDLKKAIIQREFEQGSTLPDENMLARNFQVARSTLRIALGRLEQDGLIKRIKGHGTMICGGENRPILTYLLPSPHYLSDHAYTGRSQRLHSLLLQGISQATFEEEFRVETLSVTQNNNNQDIYWQKLLSINKNSLVVICGLWFEPLFDYLKRLDCKVVIIYSVVSELEEQIAPFLPENWSRFILDEYAVEKASLEAILPNCHGNILVTYLSEKNYIYCSKLLSRHPAADRFIMVRGKELLKYKNFRQYAQKNHPDSLIDGMLMDGDVHHLLQNRPHWSLSPIKHSAVFRSWTTLPAEGAVVGDIHYDFMISQIGYRAAELLTATNYQAVEQTFAPVIRYINPKEKK